MKLRYYAEADVEVDHRHTLRLLESISETHAISVEVVQVEPQRAPSADFTGATEQRSLDEAWDDFTYNRTLQNGLGAAPSDHYRNPDDIVGNVGVVVEDDLVWATQFWGTHHGWGAVDPEQTAIGFLEEVEARGPKPIVERIPESVDLAITAESYSDTGSDSGSDNSDETGAPVTDDSFGAETSTTDLYEPTRDTIRDICTAQSFQRGVGYFEEGRVRDLSVEGSEVTATVLGSRDYRTAVDLSAEHFAGWCSCPYDYAGDCKHIVAVLLAVRDRYDEVVSRSAADATAERSPERTATVSTDQSEPADTLERALADTDTESLRAFLRDILADHEDLRERFLATVDEPVEKSVADYQYDLNRQFESAANRRGLVEYDTHLDFGEYYDLADAYRENGRDDRALAVYRALAETIRENLGRIDDSRGHYGREIERAVDAYATCLREADLGDDELRNHIDYLFEQYETTEFEFVRADYDDALRAVCTTTDDLEYLHSLLQPHLPVREPSVVGTGTEPEERESESETTRTDEATAECDESEADTQTPPEGGGWVGSRDRLSRFQRAALSTYLWILSKLDDRDSLEAVLEDVYTEQVEFYRQYVDVLVADGQDDRAREAVEDGLDEFPYSAEIHRLAADFYRDRNDERHRDMLKTLFVRFENWEAYDDLKAACSDEEWASTFHGLTTQLGRLDPDQLIDLYVYEDEREKAFEKVLESEDLDALRRYRGNVADLDPERYFETYRSLLEPYLADETGRDHYRTVVDHLREMENMGFDDELAAFVDHLTEKHSNRPALLDELKKAGF